MSTLRAALLVALKDLQLEVRTKEILTSTGLFAVLGVTLGSAMPKRSAISGLTSIDLALRSNTPPPGEISAGS